MEELTVRKRDSEITEDVINISSTNHRDIQSSDDSQVGVTDGISGNRPGVEDYTDNQGPPDFSSSGQTGSEV